MTAMITTSGHWPFRRWDGRACSLGAMCSVHIDQDQSDYTKDGVAAPICWYRTDSLTCSADSPFPWPTKI